MQLFFVLSEEPLLLHKWIVDEFIVEEIVEKVDLLDEIFVDSVDSSAEDSYSVCFDRVEHLVDTDGSDLLSLNGCFDELLSVKVVVVL